jgi:hypothetical protein
MVCFSVKLGEYMVSKARRQNKILRDQKFPPDYKTTYYREAQEAISLFLAGNMEDITILERKIQLLDQMDAPKVQESRRLTGNIESIESFMNLIDEIDFKGATPKLGANSQPKMKIRNVEISVRPEVILNATGMKKKKLVGGIKLHFPKTNPLTSDASEYISTAVQMHYGSYLGEDGVAHPDYCMVIDLASGVVHKGVTASRQRQKDIESTCEQIFNLWPSIAA